MLKKKRLKILEDIKFILKETRLSNIDIINLIEKSNNKSTTLSRSGAAK